MKLLVDPIWPWPVAVLTILALLALVRWTYPPRVAHLPLRTRRTLIGLRYAAVVLLAAAMFRPAVQFSETDQQTAALLILADSSRSMKTPDGPGGTTRRQTLLKTLADAEPQLQTFGQLVEVRYYDFGRELKAVAAPGPDAEGDQTAIGAVLDALLKETQQQRVVGVVLLSDGAQRAVSPYDADPRMVARRYGELRVPVYTVRFGGSGVTGTTLDVAVEDLLVSPVVFEKKLVPVSAKVRVRGEVGQKVTVRLLVEDRSGKRPGQAGVLQPATASGNAVPLAEILPTGRDGVYDVELSFVPQQAGELKIRVEVDPLPGDLKQSNNARQTLLTVRKGGINVAYFDIPRPEQKFLRAVNESDKIQLDYFPVRGGEFQGATVIDPDVFAPGRYDVYLIGDVPASVFGPTHLQRLAARVEEGAGLMMTGGYNNFGAGGYAETPLADLLPVRMSSTERTPPGELPHASDLHRFQPLKMQPTTLGLQRFVMRIDTGENNLQRWQSLPPLEGANILRKKLGLVEVLAESPEGHELLLAHEVGRARVMAFAADTTYQWVLAGQRDAHQRFWQQAILWLAHKELDTDQPVWVTAEPRNVAPRQRVNLRFGARTAEGQPIPDAQFAVNVTAPDGASHAVSPRRGDREQTAEVVQTEIPGDYWVRVEARQGGQSPGFDAYARFIVDDRDLELDNPAADPALLEEISWLTGGLSMPPEQLASHLTHLLEQGLSHVEITKLTRVTLWDNWGLLVAFVGLMSVEWFLRKRRGLV